MDWTEILARAGLIDAFLAWLTLLLAPVGWRAGLWHFRTSFYRVMPAAVLLAILAIPLAVAALVLGWPNLGAGGLTEAGVAIVAGLALIGMIGAYKRTLDSVPRIHDITTDTANPPIFLAVLEARKAERANSTEYSGGEIARLQAAAYPGVVPLVTKLSRADVFAAAAQAAEAMPGWAVVAKDAESGRIEATETSRWFGFSDDVVVRVTPLADGSRVDVRSVSRQGISDLGVNARRIGAYLAALRPKVL